MSTASLNADSAPRLWRTIVPSPIGQPRRGLDPHRRFKAPKTLVNDPATFLVS